MNRILFVALILLGGCGGLRNKERQKNLVRFNEQIDGQWLMSCQHEKYTNPVTNEAYVWVIKEYEFNQGNFSKSQKVFSDTKCSELMGELNISGTFSIEKTSAIDVFHFIRNDQNSEVTGETFPEFLPEGSGDRPDVTLKQDELVFGVIDRKGYGKAFYYGDNNYQRK